MLSPPAPFLDGAPPSSAQLVSVSSNETAIAEQEIQEEEKPIEKENSTSNKTKLYDGSVNQVIEEVQTEQEAKIAEQKYKSSLPPSQQEGKEEEQGGYLSNFRKKFTNLQDPEGSDNQQVQVSSQIDTTTTETSKKGHKGIMERFNDKINEDVSD